MLNIIFPRFPAQVIILCSSNAISLNPLPNQSNYVIIAGSLLRALFSSEETAWLSFLAIAYSYMRVNQKSKANDCFADKLETILNTLPVGVGIKSLDEGRFVFCNPTLGGIFGFNCNDKAECAQMQKIMEGINNEIKQPGNFSDSKIDFTIIKEKISTKYTLEINGRIITWKGQQAMMYTIKHVIQQGNRDTLKIANTIKTRLLKSLSHELRTPIHCILTSLDYCKKKLENDEESLGNINIAKANSNFLLYKYNDLLVLLY